MTLTVEPLDAPLGARVTGIDLRQSVEAEAFDAIYRAWMDHQVLIFPGQEIDEADQIRFSLMFGEMPTRDRYEGRNEKDTGDKSIMLVSNVREKGKQIGSLPDGEMMFHTDGAYDEHPYKFTFLYAVDLPSVGGNTVFADMYRAYDTLSDDVKRDLEQATVRHGYYSGTVQRGENVGPYSGDAIHPLFIAHGDTGRTAIYASRLLTQRILELDEAESDRVLDQLFDHCERPELIYEHVWSPGDFVMWDNRCTNHARTDFARSERRLLRRTVVQGVRPTPACVVAA
jgi:taurine dioxygenase